VAFELPFPRSAIVTGGARRIGAEIVRALADDGWDVLIHCRDSSDRAQALAADIGRARIAVSDLAQADPCGPILEALADMPPLGLLVNNASGFVQDDFFDFTAESWAAHFDVNLRAPALLSRMFAELTGGAGGLIVNLLDAKLAQPNPDFFTYTLSKIGLAGLTELTARKLAADKIRVCGIAPSVTLVSGPQSRENFELVHGMNALRRGVRVEEIVGALRFIIATPSVTGQTLVLDGGQRFLSLPRDVQYMVEE
jgi:NAD(P)-dependent dehydrogenase (short-subunit alcohol dehydrogenase family)